ncbi:MAG: hypothetical protein J7515_05215 [Caulobacter sp.]|nr:hypothetical protein [Caulobacter sp.]
MLREQEARIQRALHLISAARVKAVQLGSLSSDDLMTLTKELNMTEKHQEAMHAAYEAVAAKHFTPEDQASLAANGYRGMASVDMEWTQLHAEATRLMTVGDPSTPEAMDLARRWMLKVFEATGGDPGLTRKMRDVARKTHDQPGFAAASSSSNAMMDFVAQAYGAAIEVGLMPRPEGA